MKGPVTLTVEIRQDGTFIGRAGCYMSSEALDDIKSIVGQDCESLLLDALLEELRFGIRRALRSCV